MELHEGMYVRTKYGEIFSVNNTDTECYGYKEEVVCVESKESPVYLILVKDITKKSYNLIDLIEVGDYVNGYKVYSGGKKHFDYIIIWDDKCDYFMEIPLHIVDIKSILTKEQFEQNSYKVGE